MYNIRKLADFVNGKLNYISNEDVKINSIASLIDANNNQIAYIEHKKYLSDLKKTKAGVVLITEHMLNDCPTNSIIVDNPQLEFAKLSKLFKAYPSITDGIHHSAVISKSAIIGNNVKIGPYCIVGENVVIKNNCTIHSHCVLEDNVTLGKNCYLHPNVSLLIGVKIADNVIIHSGTVIGSDGFGNARDDNNKWHKIHHVGSVTIGSNVEIGANSAIDRGVIDDTIISDGVRIDNLVHIAHNVVIGEDSAIAACVGIAGSTTLGKRVLVGGVVGIAGHINIVDDVIINGKSSVDKSITQKGVYTGIVPIMKHKQWQVVSLWLTKLDKIIKFLNIKLRDLKD